MPDLTDYGYTSFFEAQADNSEELIPARVTAVYRELYGAVCMHGETTARLAGSLYHEGGLFPAVGDFVLIRYNDCGESIIAAVLARRSKFSRSDFSGHSAEYAKTVLEQVVAANFDYVFILASLNHDFNLRRIERYLAAAWQSGGTSVVLLTKADLVPDPAERIRDAERVAIGVDVHAVSVVTGQGLDALGAYLRPGRTAVFLGSSGVGKSSLLNALMGKEIMKVNTIREDDSKGRHTTTHRQLFMLPCGAMVIDTPGMREIGMWDVSEGLGNTFADVEEIIRRCRFSDCRHETEPGCAIKEAIANGELTWERWDSYRKLAAEARFVGDKAGYLREKQQWQKSIAKMTKQKKKNGEIKR